MSKAPAKPAKAAKPAKGAKGAKPAKGGGKGLLVPFVILGIAGVFVLPATIVAIGGFIPTIATMITDKSRGRSMTVAVGALNMTGVAYVVIQLFQKGISMNYAMMLLQDPLNWLIMWGGAAIGLALLTIIPPMVAQVLTSISELKMQKMKANQAEIRKIWGEDVKN